MEDQTLYRVHFTAEEYNLLFGMYKDTLQELSSGISIDRMRSDAWNEMLVNHNILSALVGAELVSLNVDLYEH